MPKNPDSLTLTKIFEAGEFEGIPFTRLNRPLEPGDTYLVQGNLKVHLLTARTIDTEHGFVVPVERAYPFNIPGCHPIQLHL